jgi:hypothetical protein
MGLNPTILRQAQAFAFLFQPTDTRRPYRASGLVLTSTPDGYGRRVCVDSSRSEWARSGVRRRLVKRLKSPVMALVGDTPMSTWLSPRRPIRSTELSFAPRTTIRPARKDILP